MSDEEKIIFPEEFKITVSGTELKMYPLCLNDIIKIFKDIVSIVKEVGTGAPNVDVNKMTPDDFQMFLPVIGEVKKVLALSFKVEEEWLGDNCDLFTLSEMLIAFFRVNRIGELLKNFQRAKTILK